MNKISYEEYLEKNKVLVYRNTGISMLPLLKQGRDLFVVTKKTSDRCKKYDVVLFKRNDDKYVLHRIIKVNKHDYIIRGDNCVNAEYGIKDEDILGVMTSFIRKGKEHSVNNYLYRIYSVMWTNFYFLRRIYQRVFYRP